MSAFFHYVVIDENDLQRCFSEAFGVFESAIASLEYRLSRDKLYQSLANSDERMFDEYAVDDEDVSRLELELDCLFSAYETLQQRVRDSTYCKGSDKLELRLVHLSEFDVLDDEGERLVVHFDDSAEEFLWVLSPALQFTPSAALLTERTKLHHVFGCVVGE